ncbi:MAG: hypothetical protein MUC97_17350 [Bernardetiaceae bacterium]|jgi:hypothetical protein|nr:hypothetical protein [Bernardetiaceae bacterium]
MGACTQGLNDVVPDHTLGTTSLGTVDQPGQPLADYKLPILKTKQGRLVFKDRFEFMDMAAKISASGVATAEAWEKSHPGFTSYLTQVRNTRTWDSLANLFTFDARLLNFKGEFQLGDTIAWYHQGAYYYFPNGNEAELAEVQRRGGDPARAYPVTRNTRVISSGRSEGTERFEEKYFKEYNTATHTLKISFALISEVRKYYNGPNTTRIGTKISLVYWQPGSWPTPGRWRQAGENRISNISNLNFTVSHLLITGLYTNSVPLTPTYLNADYDLDVLLGQEVQISTGEDYWEARVNGNYSCQVTNPGHSAGTYTVNGANWFWQ